MDMSVGNDSSATCVDNAAVAMSHMIMASPNDVPLVTMLPVVLKSLPLKNDMTANETVYKCLLGLMEMKNAKAVNSKLEIGGALKRLWKIIQHWKRYEKH